MGSVYLGVDIGTTSAKCLAVGDGGEVLAFAQHPYALSHPQQGWAEQDPLEFRHALANVVGRCVAELREKGHRAEDVVSLAMSTQGDTLIVTDDDGTPFAPVMSWMDARAEDEFRELLSEAGPSFWYRETGQPMNALSSACKIRWLEKHRPDIRERARFRWVADFLSKWLCGRFAADVPSASWTPLYSPAKRDWSAPVLELLGVPLEALPETPESGSVIGNLLPDAAAELGLSPKTVLVAGAFDQAAAAHGAGASVGGRSVLSCGTAWVLYSVSGEPPLDEQEKLCVCCHARPSEWGLVLPFTGGSAYDWLNRTLNDPSHDAGSHAEPLIFIPHLYGGLSPDWRGESKGSLLGLTMAHTREDIRQALMRGIACEARRNLEAAERLGVRADSVRMVGGAGKSEVWPQMVANILNLPVDVSGCVESACLGAARLAAAERADDWTASTPVRTHAPSEPDASKEEEFYLRYKEAYEMMLGLYRWTTDNG